MSGKPNPQPQIGDVDEVEVVRRDGSKGIAKLKVVGTTAKPRPKASEKAPAGPPKP